MLDTVDFGRNPSGAEFGEYGVLYVRHGKAKKGSPPKRRGVVTVWDWSAEVLQEWLEEVRPLFPTAASSACWPLGTRAVCGLATACSTTRSGGRSTSSGSPTRGSPIMGPFSSEPFALGLEALLLDSGDFDVVFVDDPAMWARDVAVDGSAILIVEGVDPAVCQRYLDERRVHSVVLFDPVGAQAFVGLENPDWQTLVEVLRAAARDVTAEQVHVVDPRALASPCRGETTRSAGRVVRTWQYARWTDGASSSGSAGSTAPRPRATTAACASMRSTRLAVLVSRKRGSLTGAAVVEEVVGGLGPDERVAAFVPAVDERTDGGDQLFDAAEAAAADGLAGDDREEDLDQVQPRPQVGVKCRVILGLRASHARTAGWLWVA